MFRESTEVYLLTGASARFELTQSKLFFSQVNKTLSKENINKLECYKAAPVMEHICCCHSGLPFATKTHRCDNRWLGFAIVETLRYGDY